MTIPFTAEDDFVRKADFWFGAAPGTLVQLVDGRAATVCYHNLDGYGVVFGDRPDLAGKDSDYLPEPEALLRDPFAGSDWPCVGELVRVLRKIKPDGTRIDHLSPEDAGVVE